MASICLNMIVKNEAHVIEQTLDCVSSRIDSWIIVDTGSTDETMALIRGYFERAGVPGELHERPWVDFGTNRTEALRLCANRGDYVWVIDADDLIVGDLVLPKELTLDAYELKYGRRFRYWRPQILRNDGSWHYEGVIHEYPACERKESSSGKIEGDYYIDSRRLGDRNRQADKYERDAALLRRQLEQNPSDARSMFYLAQSYFDMGDYERALSCYRSRATMEGWSEEVYYSLVRAASCLEHLKRPWGEVIAAFLEAFQYRPSRAEPLHYIANHYRDHQQHHLAHCFAQLASEIPFPEQDQLFVNKEIYDYRADDELALASYYTGRYRDSYAICQRMLNQQCLPDEQERERVIGNRDFAVEQIKDETLPYPAQRVEVLTRRATARRRSGKTRCHITLTITTCKRLDLFCKTINSFLQTCSDVERIGRWICVDDNSSEADREVMARRYPFFEFVWKDEADKGHARSMNLLLERLDSPRWIHLEDDWHFFDDRHYVSEALSVLEDDRRLGQVLFNRNYGEALSCRAIVGGLVKQTRKSNLRYRLHQHIAAGTEDYSAFFKDYPPGAVSNVYWPHYSLRPSMLRTSAIRAVGRFDTEVEHFELDFAKRYKDSGYRSAFFDLITCLHIGRRTWDRNDTGSPNAYILNKERQF